MVATPEGLDKLKPVLRVVTRRGSKTALFRQELMHPVFGHE
jgi:hypothetical protein